MHTSAFWGGMILALALLAGVFWYTQDHTNTTATHEATYRYECSDESEFSMIPAGDVASITVVPGTDAAFTRTTLSFTDDRAGQRFEGGGIVFVGTGEKVTLTYASSTITCMPVLDTEMAPWNWGDATAGSSASADMSITRENLVGVWQSTQDPKFIRDFKPDGTVIDSYEGTDPTPGTYVVFSKTDAPTVDFPVQEGATYVRISMGGTEADALDFAVLAATSEALQLVYLARGNTLDFKRI